VNQWTGSNWDLWGSLLALLACSELAAANFKRLAPVLEALEQKRSPGNQVEATEHTFLWAGGWEKLAVLCWALGSAMPYIAFSLGVLFFIPNQQTEGDLIVGLTMGANILALSLSFGLIMSRGHLSFFRIRSMTSPIFLLLATVAFSLVCINNRISRLEGATLVAIGISYGIYFRRFSSEWKSYERHHASRSLLEATEGIMPAVAVTCMGLGFTVLAVLFSYTFVRWTSVSDVATHSTLALHIVAPVLALPSILRALHTRKLSDTGTALTLTGITHVCLLNTLLLCGSIALVRPLVVNAALTRVDLAALLCLTGVFAATLMIEKERDHGLSWTLILAFLVYTGVGLFL
jgi:hypothetical protein